MTNKGKGWRLATVAAALMMTGSAWATEYAASFKNADIEEFINTVGKNLNKTIIIEPSVRGKINVRSYDLLNEDQYYQFFLSVLDVYGFAVVPMNNGVLKVVRSKDAKTSAIPVVDDTNPGVGDEMVTRVVPVRNVSVRELAPLLRQLNDNAGGGNVVHYEPSNVLLITGRAAVVNRLVEVVRRVDKAGDQDMDVIKLKYASAGEMVRLVTNLNKDGNNQGANASLLLSPKVVADERTNSVVISGEPKARARIIQMVRQLDRDLQSQGNTRVFYLKYGKAKDLVDVLKGVSSSIEADKKGGAATGGGASIGGGQLAISADETTTSWPSWSRSSPSSTSAAPRCWWRRSSSRSRTVTASTSGCSGPTPMAAAPSSPIPVCPSDPPSSRARITTTTATPTGSKTCSVISAAWRPASTRGTGPCW